MQWRNKGGASESMHRGAQQLGERGNIRDGINSQKYVREDFIFWRSFLVQKICAKVGEDLFKYYWRSHILFCKSGFKSKRQLIEVSKLLRVELLRAQKYFLPPGAGYPRFANEHHRQQHNHRSTYSVSTLCLHSLILYVAYNYPKQIVWKFLFLGECNTLNWLSL